MRIQIHDEKVVALLLKLANENGVTPTAMVNHLITSQKKHNDAQGNKYEKEHN